MRRVDFKTNKNYPIGVFDSGLGGLTVLKKVQELLPNENFIYFGDTAHLPYGSKSDKCIIEYSDKIVQFLISKNVKAIIIACNSASSIAKKHIEKKYDIKIFEVITPAVKEAVNRTKTKHIGVIGTETTIFSQAYSNEVSLIDNSINITEIACPLLVPIIEEGLQDNKILIEIITLYLNPIINSNIDTLILGCTHYPIIKKKLKNFLPNNINYVTSGVPVAKTLEGYLAKNNLYNSIDNSSIKFYVSDNLDKFKRLGSKFSNNPITDIELIQL